MLEHQMVFFEYLFARDVFRVGKLVTNQFEYQRIAWQRKHRHDHAAFTVCVCAVLLGVFFKVTKKVAVAFGLALFCTTEHCIYFGNRFARQ